MACYQIRCSGHAQPCTSTVNIFKQTVPVTEKNLKSPHSRSHLLLLISSFQLTFALQPTLSEMPSPVALPTSHYFHPSASLKLRPYGAIQICLLLLLLLSPVVSLSLGTLHEWLRTQMLANPSWNHRGGHRQPWWRTFMMTCSLLDLGIHEARDLAQNRPLLRLISLHSATHP